MIDDLLKLVKLNLGLTEDVQDDYLRSIISAVIAELKLQDVDPDGQSDEYVTEYEAYVVDKSAWMYRYRGGEEPEPRYMEFRRHNLKVSRNDV